MQNDPLPQGTRRRTGTVRALIREKMEAGWTDIEAMWGHLQREHPNRYLPWSYTLKVARDWQKEHADG